MHNIIPRTGMPMRLYHKIMLIMRLTTIILIASLMQVSAAGFAQKISLYKTNAPLKAILREIRSQVGYDYVATEDLFDISKPVTVNLKGVNIKDALDLIFENQSLDYSINKTTIIIKEKMPSFSKGFISQFQTIDIKGKVVDSLGNGLSGATVLVKNGKGSTFSTANGAFSLKNVEEGATLVVSYLGYVTKEVTITKEFNYVQLSHSSSKLDEVQIIAYGLTTRRLSTGNIGTIKSSDIEKQPINNPLYSLQGRIAGVVITPNTGLIGGPIDIEIRGRNTIRSDFEGAEPLIVIDGLPTVNNIPGLRGAGLERFSSLSFLNPNEIESIDVLKDADATSIYGSRGANGVVLITTKKGEVGNMDVDVNIQSGLSVVPQKINLLRTADYLMIRKEAYQNSNVNLDGQSLRVANADLKLWDQTRFTNWQEELIGGSARFNDFQGRLSGGSSNLRYIFGGNYHSETTVFPGSNLDQRGSGHIGITGFSHDSKFKAIGTANYMSNSTHSAGADFTNAALTLPPNAPMPYKADGSINWETLPSGAKSWENPYVSLLTPYEANVKNLITNADLSYSPRPFITFKTAASYSQLSGNSLRKTPIAAANPDEVDARGNIDIATNSVVNISVEPQMNLHFRFNKGVLTGLVGSSFQSSTITTLDVTGGGISNDVLINNLQSAEGYLAANSKSEYRYNAFFTRINYNWGNRYIININARRDGSSRFGPGKQFGNFFSVGGAWILSEEQSVKKLIPCLSFGKLRASYGTSGNDGIGNYKYLDRYTSVSDVNPYQGVRSYRSEGLYNPYYAWEVTKKLEVGLETGFLKDRILLSASVFRNRSDNQLLNPPYPSMSGPGTLLFNLPALIQNHGFELSLQTLNINHTSFKWSTNFNFTRNRNKLVSFPGLEQSPYYSSFEIGQPFYGTFNAFKSAGVSVQNGIYMFEDRNGNIVANPEDPTRLDGGRYLRIMTTPSFYGGISNAFSFNGLEVDLFIQFNKQNKINPYLGMISTAGYQRNLPVDFLSRWQDQNENGVFQQFFMTINGTQELRDAASKLASSDFAYVDASFIRIKNVSLSYSIPKNWCKAIGASKIRAYLQGVNLWTFTSYKGLDPEAAAVTSLPPLRTITSGLQIIF